MYIKSIVYGIPNFSKLIMPKKVFKQPKNDLKEIAKHFSIKVQQNDTDQLIIQKYLKYWKSPALQEKKDLLQLFRAQKQLKLVEFTKKLIAVNYDSYNAQVEAVINNFFMYLLDKMNFNRLSKLTSEEIRIWSNQLTEIVSSINHYSFFMKKSKHFCFRYLNLLFFVQNKSKSFGYNDYSLNLKMVLDQLIQIPHRQLSQSQARFLFSFVSIFNVQVWYYQKADQIIQYTWQCLPSNWQQIPQVRMNILKSISSLRIESKQINMKTWKIFYQSNQEKAAVYAFVVLIKNFEITPQNCENPKLKQKITKLAQSDSRLNFFQNTAHQLYRALVWLPEFWLPYFQFAMDNSESFTLFNHFTIFELLNIEKDTIPKEVYKKGKELQAKIKKEYQQITMSDIQKQYERLYSSYIKKLSCQTQLANSFRLLNKGQVRTEAALGMFNVDILINNKYVIQVNGGSHYLINIDTKQKRTTLKSLFRQKILSKMGYHVFSVDVTEFNEGSFEIVSSITEKIEQLQNAAKIQAL